MVNRAITEFVAFLMKPQRVRRAQRQWGRLATQ